MVDLTLTVEEVIEVQTGRWNVERIHQFIHAEDVDLVLRTPVSRSRGDKIVWSFTRDGKYNTRSGYKLLETLEDIQSNHSSSLPPLEKQLWKSRWKLKAPPKIKHFLWRML